MPASARGQGNRRCLARSAAQARRPRWRRRGRGSTSSAASPRRHHAPTLARECSLNHLVMRDSKPAPSRVNLRKQMSEITRLRQEMTAKTPDQRRTTTRAVARILDDVHLEGRMGKFVVESDEPVARGGTEKGPSPLQYVMMGTAF